MSDPFEQFNSDGYLVARRLLDPEHGVARVGEAYIQLLDRLYSSYLEEAQIDLDDEQLSFPERFAVTQVASRGHVLHHIDPVLNIFEPDFQWRGDLPEARIPEIFDLICHPRFVDRLEKLLGPRITASPIQHVNIKLALKHLKLARRISEPGGITIKNSFRGFLPGKTQWHMDAITCLPDSHISRIINAWIPVTPAGEENGCLRVIPDSHKNGVQYPPYPRNLDRKGLSLPAEPGDVIFLDNKLMHGSTLNTSSSNYHLAFNFRYLPTGQPNGRPFLPEFVVRDRTAPANELHDARTWAMMWRGCLRYLSRVGVPITYEDVGRLSPEAAHQFANYWKMLASDHNDWVRLGETDLR